MKPKICIEKDYCLGDIIYNLLGDDQKCNYGHFHSSIKVNYDDIPTYKEAKHILAQIQMNTPVIIKATYLHDNVLTILSGGKYLYILNKFIHDETVKFVTEINTLTNDIGYTRYCDMSESERNIFHSTNILLLIYEYDSNISNKHIALKYY